MRYNSFMKKLNVLIVGGGIGGLAAAVAMQKAGLKVTVFEQSAAITEVGAGISISPNAALAIKALGLAEEFHRVAYAPEYQVVRHWESGKQLAQVTRGARLMETYGERYYTVHRADLQGLLAKAVSAHDPDAIRLGHRFERFEQDADGVTVHFSGGQSARGDVLLGADGVRSRVRSQLFGPEEVRFTGFIAYRGLVPMELVPKEAMDPACQVWMGRRLMLNRYPVSGGKLLNFVAFALRSGWEDEGWSTPASKAEILQDYAGWHPHVTKIIEAAPEASLFKWALCARSALMRWVDGRVALLGDAAHPVLPYLGQGAVMALEDSVILGRALSAAPNIEEGLARYEAARVGRTRFIVERSTAMGQVWFGDTPETFVQDTPVDEALGLFAYDPGKVPV